jgi:hypothetical protein
MKQVTSEPCGLYNKLYRSPEKVSKINFSLSPFYLSGLQCQFCVPFCLIKYCACAPEHWYLSASQGQRDRESKPTSGHSVNGNEVMHETTYATEHFKDSIHATDPNA